MARTKLAPASRGSHPGSVTKWCNKLAEHGAGASYASRVRPDLTEEANVSKFSHLWNDLPSAERSRLFPYQVESQLLQLQQARVLIVENHNRMLREMDAWIANIQRDLDKLDVQAVNQS